ncbi:YbaN family protein [Gemmobacter serpentinus]|uniref:YbaN family protein n=1 Tax=Gemmobacter serpentinus TaxID=2652247 RepID=UPI00124DB212|nr:YbaN family protein [Gemmobacter serpentinus]
MKLVWLILGCLAVAVGVIGVFLPLLPTTPFMILAAACFAKSSDRLHGWLMGHRVFGPMIRDWRAHRAIPRRGKRAALIAMGLAFLLSVALGVAWWALLLQALVLVTMGSWIWTRAEPPSDN